jgi:hypothetical protein
MASLVEARRDGRLGDREGGSLERHLASCAECRQLDRGLDEVRTLLRKPVGPELTPLEHQRSRLALLRAAASPVVKRSPLRWRAPPMAFAAAASIATAALAVTAATGTLRVHVPVAQHFPAHRVGAHVAEVTERRETVIDPSADARFDRTTEDRLERVALAEGTLDLKVRKLGEGERFLVATDDAEVEVRGTVFEVEAHAGKIARVAVSEGKVEVRHRRAVSIVAAGGAWQPPVEDPVLASRAEVSPLDAARATGRPMRNRASGSHHVRARGEHGDDERPDAEDASKDFDQAVDVLGQGDYAAARERLDAFRAAHPGDDRADLAAFLAIVSLQRAGRKAEARDAARHYLDTYPKGDRRAEAQRVASGM